MAASPLQTKFALADGGSLRIEQDVVWKNEKLDAAPKQRLWIEDGLIGVTGAGVAHQGLTLKEKQELLWQAFFSDPAQWWDNRKEKRSPRHPDFRHKGSKKALWVNNRHKPGWLDSQLAIWDGTASSSGSETAAGSEGGSEVVGGRMLCGDGELAEVVDALNVLVRRGCHVDSSLLYPVVKRCLAERDLVVGRRVHDLILQSGNGADPFLANHMIRMYASHAMLEEARQVFGNLGVGNAFVWASIIKAHADHGQPARAVRLYREMRCSGVKPNDYVFVAVLKACAAAADLVSGKEVHADIMESVDCPDMFVGSCLIDMYAKCGSLEDARSVFDSMATKDVVAWTALISGYVQHELGAEALKLYRSMQQEGLEAADRATFICLLKACGSVAALHQGKQLHSLIERKGLDGDILVGSCLVDMYAKCGSLEDARGVFARLATRDVVAWTALLNGYAKHGEGKAAIQCFEEMVRQGVKPNAATFVSLLVACCHEGLLKEGQRYFKMMVEEQGIAPTDSHYNCMVDLLGRSGYLDEAESMLRTMPFESEFVGWTSLLTSCKSYSDIERGRRCFDRLTALEPENAAAYVVLGNIYAKAGRWKDVDTIEMLRKSAAAWKKPAKACIEVKDEVHEFTVGEERPDISSALRSMNSRVKDEGGHVPQTELVLKAMSDSDKEDALCGHAEKLALAYGLLNTPDGTTLVVTKNLRMCNDCHSSTKILSQLEKRDIIVRDAHRVHHFLDGSCSCGDRH